MATQTSRLVIEIDSRNAARNAREIANELQNIQRNGDSASRSMNATSSAARSLAGYMAGLLTVGAAISRMDTYTGLQNRLKLVTDSQKELNQAMDDTFRIAQNTGSAWDSVAMVYQRFADNADRLGISMSKTAELAETVSKAIAISGGSAASAEAALTQFGQALASGVLRGEEFNSIAEQAPGLLKAIAFGMNVNIGELRTMAAEGKITGDALVDALTKAKAQVDDLFGKTDFTIANSLTQLSNAVTQFVGEAGKGSGAASLLSESISSLAKNLSTVADIAIVGGVTLLTKAILTQAVAMHGAAAASVQRRAADLAALQTQVQLAGVEVQRTRQVAALALTEINLARQELNSATTRQARAAATMRLTQAEIALAIAKKQTTAATAAQVAIENTLNTSRARSAVLLGAIGGPIGAITIGVAALAAGYIHLKNRAAEANAKLEEQGKIAEKTDKELRELSGNDKISAAKDLTAAFNSQNKALEESKKSVDAVLFAIRAVSVENERARKITEDARRGIISYDEAIKLLNNEKIPTHLYDELRKQAIQYDENSEKAGKSQKALKSLGDDVKLTGNAAQDAAVKHRTQADAIGSVSEAAMKASKDLQDYRNKLQEGNLTNLYESSYISKGYTPAQAKALTEAQKAVGLESGILSDQQISNALDSVRIAEQRNKLEDDFNDKKKAAVKAEKDATKEAARKAKEAAKEAERLAKEVAELRYDLTYKYSNREIQLQYDLEKEKDDIRKAFASNPAKMNEYIGWAEKRHKAEKELYEIELGSELYSFKMNEVEKLNLWREIESRKIGLINESFKGERDTRRRALNLQYADGLAMIKLAKEERAFQMQQGLMHANARSEEYWNLERQRISLNVKDLSERNKQLAIANSLQAEEKRTNFNTAVQQWGGVNAELTGTEDQFNLEKERFDQLEVSQSLFDAQLAMAGENHALMEQAYRDHVERMSMIEGAYHQKSIGLQLGYAQGITGALAGMFGAMLGESSSAYRVLYAAQQSFALAQAGMNVWKSASDAYANEPGTVWQKAGAAALATIESGAFVTLIQTATPKGFSDGGFTGAGGKFDPAGIVHKGEVVWSQNDIKRWGGVSVVEAMRTSQPSKGYSSGGVVSAPSDTYRVGMGAVNAIRHNSQSNQNPDYGDVNIEVNVTDSGVSTSGNNQDQKQLGQMMGNAIRAVIIQEKRQGGLLSK